MFHYFGKQEDVRREIIEMHLSNKKMSRPVPFCKKHMLF